MFLCYYIFNLEYLVYIIEVKKKNCKSLSFYKFFIFNFFVEISFHRHECDITCLDFSSWHHERRVERNQFYPRQPTPSGDT